MADRPTALVTGANRGIGLATARQLAEGHGYRVLMGSREERLGEQASEALVASGLSVEPVKLDVTKEADRAAVARQLERRRRPIHLLVNNAGVALDGFNEQVVRETLSVNFYRRDEADRRPLARDRRWRRHYLRLERDG